MNTVDSVKHSWQEQLTFSKTQGWKTLSYNFKPYWLNVAHYRNSLWDEAQEKVEEKQFNSNVTSDKKKKTATQLPL